jgi:hypothetical protein
VTEPKPRDSVWPAVAIVGLLCLTAIAMTWIIAR